MPEQAEILDSPQFEDQQAPEQSGDPIVDPNKQKRDAIIVQMYKKGATKKEIETVVEHFKTLSATPPTPKPQQPSVPQTNTSPAQPTQPDYRGLVGIPTMEDQAQMVQKAHSDAVDGSLKNLTDILNNDKIVNPIAEKMLIDKRQNDLRDAAGRVNVGATDHPVRIPTQFGVAPTPEEVMDLTQQIRTNPDLAVQALQRVKEAHPDKAKEIDKALYLVNAQKRAVDTDKQRQILETADRIGADNKDDVVKYDALNDRVIKETGLGESFNDASKSRADDMALFELADNGRKSDLIDKLNEITAEHDPDKPVPTPTGLWGKVGEFGGGQGEVMSQVAAAQALNVIPGFGTALAESISGGLFAHEMARRGYAKELTKSYGAFRRQGMSEVESLEKAQEQAKKAMITDAITAGAMGAVTSGAASKLLKTTPAAEAMVNKINAQKLASEGGWFQGVIKNGYKMVKQEAPAGINNATLAGGGEMLKNLSAIKGGEKRDASEGAMDAATNMFMLHYTLSSAFAVLGKVGNKIANSGSTEGVKVYNRLLQGFAKVPLEDAKIIAKEQVDAGLVAPHEAAKNLEAIEAHKEIDEKIRPDVSNDEVRMHLQEWERKRQIAEEEKKRVSGAFKESASKEIERIDAKMNEIANSPEAKEESPKQPESKISVIKPEDNTHPNIVENVKTENDAISQPESNEVGVRNEATVDEAVGSGDTQPKEIAGTQSEPVISSEESTLPQGDNNEEGLTGITHAQMNEVSKEFGLPEYEGSPEKIPEWNQQADERLSKPNALPDLFEKLRKGDVPDHVETMMMIKYMADLKAKLEVDPKSDELLAQLKRAKDLFNVAGRIQGKSFRARQEMLPTEKTLPDFLLREMETAKVDKLTDAQKEQAAKEHSEISTSETELADKVAKLEVENAKLKADKAVKKVKSETPKGKKTHEDYVKERADAVEKMRADLLKVAKGGGGAMSSVPGVAQLAAIAPHVAKLVKSFVEEGIAELPELVKRIHEHLKDVVDGITEKNVHDLIAGEYNEKKTTRSELAAKVIDLKEEAKLINKLERLEAGAEPKSEKAKVERNRQITELREKIKEFKKDPSKSDEGFEYKVNNPEHESAIKRVDALKLKLSDLEKGVEQNNKKTSRAKTAEEEKLEAELLVAKKKVSDAEKNKEPFKYNVDSPEEKTTKAKVKTLEKRLVDLKTGAERNEKSDSRVKSEREMELESAIKKTKKDLEDAKKALEPFEYKTLSTEEIVSKKRIEGLKKQLIDLEAGVEQNKKRNERIKPEEEVAIEKKVSELKKKIKEAENPTKTKEQILLQAIKSRNEKELLSVQDKIKKGDFGAEEKKVPLLEDKELQKKYPDEFKAAQDAHDALLKAKEDREIRLMKEEYGQRGWKEKGVRALDEAITTGRIAKTSFDVSMPFRQGLWGMAKEILSIPIGSNKGFKQQKALASQFGKMYKALGSEKISRRQMAQIHESPRYQMAQDAGLKISEPNSRFSEAREETYGPSFIERVPFIGKPIDVGGARFGGLVKASERAATTFVNQMKWDIFNQFVDMFEANGKTFKNSPEDYKAAATYANQSVGRGKLPIALDKATPITKHLFFSLRLQASRLQLMTNLVNPFFYAKVPKEVRNAYLKDMIKFVALGTTVLGIAHSAGLKVGVNPYASDFGKIHVGDTQYDIWGGFSQWAVFLSRMIMAKSPDAGGHIKDFGKGRNDNNRLKLGFRFARSKSAPEAGMIWNLAEGRDYLGKEATLKSEALNFVNPLLIQDIYQAGQDGGVQRAVITAVLAAHGVGTQTYQKDEKASGGRKNPPAPPRERTRKGD